MLTFCEPTDRFVRLVNTQSELSLLLYITEEDRNPRLVMRLYSIAFLHAIYYTEILQPMKRLSPGVVFCLYFHKLTKHAAEETKCVSGYTRSTENEERVFKELRKLQVCTSGRPDEVAKKLMKRIQIRKATTTNHSSFVKENRKLELKAKKLPFLRRDTVFTKTCLLTTRMKSNCICNSSPIILSAAQPSCSVRKPRANLYASLMVSAKPMYAPRDQSRDTSGTPVSLNLTEALQGVSECWEKCISSKVELPLNELRLQDGDNGRVRYVAWPPVGDPTATEEENMGVNDIGETNSQGVRTRDTEDDDRNEVKAAQQREYYNDDCNAGSVEEEEEEEEEEDNEDRLLFLPF